MKILGYLGSLPAWLDWITVVKSCTPQARCQSLSVKIVELLSRCIFLICSSTWWLGRVRRLGELLQANCISSSLMQNIKKKTEKTKAKQCSCLPFASEPALPDMWGTFTPCEAGLFILLSLKVWSKGRLSIQLSPNCQVQKALKRALVELFRRALWAILSSECREDFIENHIRSTVEEMYGVMWPDTWCGMLSGMFLSNATCKKIDLITIVLRQDIIWASSLQCALLWPLCSHSKETRAVVCSG